jgi:hypothetical protein
VVLVLTTELLITVSKITTIAALTLTKTMIAWYVGVMVLCHQNPSVVIHTILVALVTA